MQPQLSLFPRQRIHYNDSIKMPELIEPQLERTKTELENILRWEEDGGLIIQTDEAVTASRL